MNKLVLVLIVLSMMACNSAPKDLQAGSNWLFSLDIGDRGVIPFQVEVKDATTLIFKNAEEQIEVTDVRYEGDSVYIKMPVFGSEFKGQFTKDNIAGTWHNYNKKDYAIPFVATKGNLARFELPEDVNTHDFSGRYNVTFQDSEGVTTQAIGIFKQTEDHRVTGTFLTETGDYRYLEGNASGYRMNLSTFDGAHAFVFNAAANPNGALKGKFYSGTHWEETWRAVKDETTQLTSADELTALLPGYKTVEFEFPDAEGKPLAFPSAAYEDKVVILQIIGTWCPNCMDETRYYTKLYDAYKDQGLEIIALDFEPTPTLDYFQPRAERFKRDLGVDYPVVLAGPSDKKEAAKSLPMLNHILSYPTSIFIAKDGSVRKIHTGFSGPGTGQAYTDFVTKTDKLVQSLLAE
ncbi:MAG: TlpA family protein disulfide reductase [Saprospiraceae bacterium]|nr:TlpA family protein disulfide reductase [Saprospiraceae bacterium]